MERVAAGEPRTHPGEDGIHLPVRRAAGGLAGRVRRRRTGGRSRGAAERALRAPRESHVGLPQPPHAQKGAFSKVFEPPEALRLARRLDFCSTRKHGSWLNLAENELSAMTRQCLRAGGPACWGRAGGNRRLGNGHERGLDRRRPVDAARRKFKSMHSRSVSWPSTRTVNAGYQQARSADQVKTFRRPQSRCRRSTGFVPDTQGGLPLPTDGPGRSNAYRERRFHPRSGPLDGQCNRSDRRREFPAPRSIPVRECGISDRVLEMEGKPTTYRSPIPLGLLHLAGPCFGNYPARTLENQKHPCRVHIDHS